MTLLASFMKTYLGIIASLKEFPFQLAQFSGVI